VAEVKWIKITTDMFDNRKIKHLRRLPDGNNIVLIWVMLLTMAGRCNSSGMIFLTENIPYTPKMLADELDFEENTVLLALRSLEQLNMIVTDNGFFSIAGWEEYQNIEGMDKIREQNRIRQAKYKQKQKLIQSGNVTDNVTVTQGNATDKDKDIEEEKEKDIINNNISPSASPSKSKKPVKKKHGEFKKVLLTDEELQKLTDEYGDILTLEAITFLDEYIAEKGYKSQSHYLAIRRWVIEAVQDRKKKPATNNAAKPKNSTDDFMNQLQQMYNEEC
jgi:predicted phage replisome organizer